MEDVPTVITVEGNAESIDLPSDESPFPLLEDFTGLNFAYIITLPLHSVHVHEQITPNNALHSDNFRGETKQPPINDLDDFISETKYTPTNDSESLAVETNFFSSTVLGTLDDVSDPTTTHFDIFNEVKATPTQDTFDAINCYPTTPPKSEIVLPTIDTKPCVTISLTPPEVDADVSATNCSSIVTDNLTDKSLEINKCLEEGVFLHKVLNSTGNEDDIVVTEVDAPASVIEIKYSTEIAKCDDIDIQYNKILLTPTPNVNDNVHGALNESQRDEQSFSYNGKKNVENAKDNNREDKNWNFTNVIKTEDNITAFDSYVQQIVGTDNGKPVRTYGKLISREQNVSSAVNNSIDGADKLINPPPESSYKIGIEGKPKPLSDTKVSPPFVIPKSIPVRKRRIILDTQKQIPIPDFKRQLLNTKDIVNVKSSVAPGTRQAMKYMELGSVSQFFLAPGRPIRSTILSRLFTNNLVIETQLTKCSNELGNVAPLDGNLNISNSQQKGTCNSSINHQTTTQRLMKDRKMLDYQFKGVRKPPVFKEYQKLQLKYPASDGKQKTYSYKRKPVGNNFGRTYTSKAKKGISACVADDSTADIEEVVYTVEDGESFVLKSQGSINVQSMNTLKCCKSLRMIVPNDHDKEVSEELDPGVKIKTNRRENTTTSGNNSRDRTF